MNGPQDKYKKVHIKSPDWKGEQHSRWRTMRNVKDTRRVPPRRPKENIEMHLATKRRHFNYLRLVGYEAVLCISVSAETQVSPEKAQIVDLVWWCKDAKLSTQWPQTRPRLCRLVARWLVLRAWLVSASPEWTHKRAHKCIQYCGQSVWLSVTRTRHWPRFVFGCSSSNHLHVPHYNWNTDCSIKPFSRQQAIRTFTHIAHSLLSLLFTNLPMAQ